MKINIEFIKLLLIAILCHVFIMIGSLLMRYSVLFENTYFEYGSFGLGLSILMGTFQYIFQHELKRRIKAIYNNWFIYRYLL